MITISACVVATGTVSNRYTDNRHSSSGSDKHPPPADTSKVFVLYEDLVPIALLSSQSAGQLVASRMLEYPELPGMVVTSVYNDLMSNIEFRGGWFQDKRQSRRVFAICALAFGITISGLYQNGSADIEEALFVAAGLKVIIGLVWVFWKQQEATRECAHT